MPVRKIGYKNFMYFCSVNAIYMGRILAIDYGNKRVGLAVTDERQIIANGLATVHSKDIIEYLKDYFAREEVDMVVVGEPLTMKGEPSEASRHIDAFLSQFRKHFPSVPVKRADERFTSKIAMQAMIDAGLRKKARQNKALVDTISATLILQDFMEQQTQRKNQP